MIFLFFSFMMVMMSIYLLLEVKSSSILDLEKNGWIFKIMKLVVYLHVLFREDVLNNSVL